MNIRSATIEDSQELVSLMHQLGYSHNISLMQKRLEECIKSGIYYCFVAEIEKNIVALIFFIIYPSFYKDSNRCLLEALIVDEQYRRQGIGKELIKFLEKRAHEYKCRSISLLSNIHRDKGTLNFYKNLGYDNEGPQAQVYLRKSIRPI